MSTLPQRPNPESYFKPPQIIESSINSYASKARKKTIKNKNAKKANERLPEANKMAAKITNNETKNTPQVTLKQELNQKTQQTTQIESLIPDMEKLSALTNFENKQIETDSLYHTREEDSSGEIMLGINGKLVIERDEDYLTSNSSLSKSSGIDHSVLNQKPLTNYITQEPKSIPEFVPKNKQNQPEQYQIYNNYNSNQMLTNYNYPDNCDQYYNNFDEQYYLPSQNTYTYMLPNHPTNQNIVNLNLTNFPTLNSFTPQQAFYNNQASFLATVPQNTVNSFDDQIIYAQIQKNFFENVTFQNDIPNNKIKNRIDIKRPQDAKQKIILDLNVYNSIIGFSLMSLITSENLEIIAIISTAGKISAKKSIINILSVLEILNKKFGTSFYDTYLDKIYIGSESCLIKREDEFKFDNCEGYDLNFFSQDDNLEFHPKLQNNLERVYQNGNADSLIDKILNKKFSKCDVKYLTQIDKFEYLCLSPLSTLATLILKNENFPKFIKKLTISGGHSPTLQTKIINYHTNFNYDPQATKLVLDSFQNLSNLEIYLFPADKLKDFQISQEKWDFLEQEFENFIEKFEKLEYLKIYDKFLNDVKNCNFEMLKRNKLNENLGNVCNNNLKVLSRLVPEFGYSLFELSIILATLKPQLITQVSSFKIDITKVQNGQLIYLNYYTKNFVNVVDAINLNGIADSLLEFMIC